MTPVPKDISKICPRSHVDAATPKSGPHCHIDAAPPLSRPRSHIAEPPLTHPRAHVVRALPVLAAMLLACERDPAAPTSPTTDDFATCPGDSRTFIQRTLPVVQGRRPYGVREVRLLADIADQLDAHGADGRLLVTTGLARGPLYERRWTHFLVDHLGVIRSGHRHVPRCWGPRTPAGDDPDLAAWVRDHDPLDMSPGTDWTMTDLLASSLALDDVRPALRAHLMTRMQAPIEGANVRADDLEAARRSNFAHSFEARYLGRRRECLTCHADAASVTDATDPAADRFWPLVTGLDAAVFGALPPADASLDAAFRVHGVVLGDTAPWSIRDDCILLVTGRTGDLLGDPAYLAGPLPQDPHVLDLDARLRDGFSALAADGLGAAAVNPEHALAALVAAHLADDVWLEASGAPLTLAHGHPRNAHARAVLADLTAALVDSDWSLRALVIAAATHPALDLATPTTCDAPLAPILDPWRADNDPADLVRRPGPWLLLDSAHTALGWPLARTFPWPYGYPDEPLLARLGVPLDEVELGARSTDLVGQLAWEARYAPGQDPGLGDPATEPDWISQLLALAAATPDATLADLAIAIHDRLLAEPDLSQTTVDAIESLLEHPLTTPLTDLPSDLREPLARRLAGAVLTTPQFLLHGLPPPPQQGAPRLVTADATTQALCEAHADLLDPPWRIDCTDLGPRVTREAP